MKHFDPAVPVEIQSKLTRIAEYIKNNLSDVVTRGESCSEGELEEISGVDYDGFIAFQDGGYEVSQYFRCDMDNSYHFNTTQTEFMDMLHLSCFKDFCSDNNLNIDTKYYDLTDEQQEELSEYEIECFEPARLSIELFVNMEDDVVIMRTEINYKDAPYYRREYNSMLKSNNMTIAEFLESSDDAIIAGITV